MRLLQVREKDGDYSVFVTYGLYKKVPHEPEVTEFLRVDSLHNIITELNIVAEINLRVIRLKDLGSDIDDGGSEFHLCAIIETSDKPSLEKIKLLAKMIRELSPTTL